MYASSRRIDCRYRFPAMAPAGDADAARKAVEFLAPAAAECRQRRRARVAEQSAACRPRLQRARHRRSRARAVRAGCATPCSASAACATAGVAEIERTLMFNVVGAAAHAGGARHRAAPLRAGAARRRRTKPSGSAARDAAAPTSVRSRHRSCVKYYEQVQGGGRASSELARAHGAGGQLQQAGADARAGVLCRRDRAAARVRAPGASPNASAWCALLGLSGEQLDFKLPERLPDLPDEPRRAEGRRADRDGQAPRRADGQARQPRATAKSLGLTKAHALRQRAGARLPEQERDRRAAAERLRDRAGAAAVRLRPTRVARAEASYMQAVHRTARSRRQRALGSARVVLGLPHGATTWPSTTATRSCRCASASPRRTCFATTAC